MGEQREECKQHSRDRDTAQMMGSEVEEEVMRLGREEDTGHGEEGSERDRQIRGGGGGGGAFATTSRLRSEAVMMMLSG